MYKYISKLLLIGNFMINFACICIVATMLVAVSAYIMMHMAKLYMWSITLSQVLQQILVQSGMEQVTLLWGGGGCLAGKLVKS